jgi:signal transduction histidine kinase
VAAEFSVASSVAWLVLSLALVVLVSVVAARRLVKPLSQLSVAVDHLGASGDDPPIPPRGPREIEGVIGAFNRMRERLRRFNQDRTRMMAAMSHDLRTALTRLRMRIEMAEGLDDRRKRTEHAPRGGGLAGPHRKRQSGLEVRFQRSWLLPRASQNHPENVTAFTQDEFTLLLIGFRGTNEFSFYAKPATEKRSFLFLVPNEDELLQI